MYFENIIDGGEDWVRISEFRTREEMREYADDRQKASLVKSLVNRGRVRLSAGEMSRSAVFHS